MGFDYSSQTCKKAAWNKMSAMEKPEVMRDYLVKVCVEGRVVGPLELGGGGGGGGGSQWYMYVKVKAQGGTTQLQMQLLEITLTCSSLRYQRPTPDQHIYPHSCRLC